MAETWKKSETFKRNKAVLEYPRHFLPINGSHDPEPSYSTGYSRNWEPAPMIRRPTSHRQKTQNAW